MPDIVHVGVNAKDVKKGKEMMPYSKVVINVDEETCYVAGNDAGATLEFDNPLGTQEIADNLLTKIQGVQYSPYTVSDGLLNPAAELGDAVTTNGVSGGLYVQETTFGHTYYADYSAPQDEQLDHEFTYESPTERKITRETAQRKAEFAITTKEISAKVSKEGGDPTAKQSFAWKLESDGFGLWSDAKRVFYCNKAGISVNGTITATAGYIGSDSNGNGGFLIAKQAISNGRGNTPSFTAQATDSTNNIYLGIDGIALGTKYTTDKNGVKTYYNVFSVSKGGTLVAKEADISGTITAKKGFIGGDSGFTIDTKKIYNGTDTITSTTPGVYLGIDGLRVWYDDAHAATIKVADNTVKVGIRSGLTSFTDNKEVKEGFYIGGEGIRLGGKNFSVSKAGELIAQSATLSGKITAKEGKIGAKADGTGGFSITADAIYNGKSSLDDTKKEGIYLGTDGIVVWNDESNYVKFKPTGAVTIARGMSSVGDITNTTGWFLGKEGLAFGGGKFKVTNKGALTATSATITGVINATTGNIGGDSGFTIKAGGVYSGADSISSTKEGIYLGKKGIRIYKDATHNATIKVDTTSAFEIMGGMKSYTDKDNDGFYIGDKGIALGGGKFKVSKSGSLNAQDATITGSITCKSLVLDGTTINGSDIEQGTVDTDQLAGNSVTKAKTDTTVSTPLDNGQAAFDYTSLISGSTIKPVKVTASQGWFTKARIASLGLDDGNDTMKVVWKSIKDKDGNSVRVLAQGGRW